MKNLTATLCLTIAVLLGNSLSNATCAQENSKKMVTKSELIPLLSGSEVEIDLDGGVMATTAWVQMDPDGNMRGENDLGNMTEGVWSVNDKGQWCCEWDDSSWRGGCHYLYRIDNHETYFQYRSPGTRLRFIRNN
jgi:hypothetical protein